MKKTVSLLLCILLAASVVTAFSLHGSAEQPKTVVLPEFEYPTQSYATFAQTGIPYEDILACFPQTIDVKYKNGAVFVQDLGVDSVGYTDHADYDYHEGELVDGYWKFEVSREIYDAGATISIGQNDHSWRAQYDHNGNRGIVFLTRNEGKFSRVLSLYPEEGYGKQFVEVAYDLHVGFRVCDRYQEGAFCGQVIEWHRGEKDIWVRYDAQGNAESVSVRVQETGEYVWLLPDQGWSKQNMEYVAADAPKGFEDATLQSFLSMLPTDIGCAHDWQAPLCDVESLCAKCKRQKGEPLGHKWVAGSMHDTCTTCNGILYRVADEPMPSFAARPYLTLEQAGIRFDDFTSECVKKISTKYQNGVFMLPNIDGYSLMVWLPEKGYLQYKTEQGWNLLPVAQEDLEKLEIFFSKTKKNGERDHNYSFQYDPDGTLTSFSLHEYESKKTVTVRFGKNAVDLSYPKDPEGKTTYVDSYRDGTLYSQVVNDRVADVEVYYNSDLQVEKVSVYVDGKTSYFFPGKGWSSDIDGKNAVSAPKGYEDKDAAYFAKTYPHTVNFCIHSYETAQDGTTKTCTKCGETVTIKREEDPNAMPILLIAAGAVLAAAVIAAVVIIVIKRSKRKKTAADQ